MSVLSLQQCPTDCLGSLGEVSFSDCAPELHYGEVAKLYIGKSNSADFTHADLIAEWTTRLSDTANGADNIRTLIGIGEVTAPEMTEVAISGDRTITGPKVYTLNFEVDETNDTNYQMMLETQCNLKYKVWIEMSDGMLYGGNIGILMVLKGNQPLLKVRTDVLKIVFTGKWKSQFDPLRTLSPMY
jgi:hypothetical protein